jgi:hypothetical protein
MAISKSKILALATTLFVFGCAREPLKPTTTSDEFPHSWGGMLKSLTDRAPFDFGCPLEQMTFNKLAGDGVTPATIGVLGCEKRATYTYINGVGWHMDSVSEEGNGTPDADPSASSEPPSSEPPSE